MVLLIAFALAVQSTESSQTSPPCQRATTAEIEACYVGRRFKSPARTTPTTLPFPVGAKPWAEFSKAPAMEPLSTVIAVGTLRPARGGGYNYWLRKAVFGGRELESISWIDSRECPAVVKVLSNMAAVNLPAPAPYGIGKGSYIVLDGIDYRLKAPASYAGAPGTVEITSNIGTPLANWVEASLVALEPCWKDTMPK